MMDLKFDVLEQVKHRRPLDPSSSTHISVIMAFRDEKDILDQIHANIYVV